MAYYPDAHTLLEKEDDTLLTLNRSMYSILSTIGLSIGSAIVIYALDSLAHALELRIIEYFSLKWLYLISIGILLEVFRRRYDDLYIFKRETVTHQDGRLSLNMSVPVLRYEDIRAVSVEQDILGRIFNYGTVSLNTASTQDVELFICGIRYPQELGAVIEGLQIMALRRNKRIPEHNPYLRAYMADIAVNAPS